MTHVDFDDWARWQRDHCVSDRTIAERRRILELFADDTDPVSATADDVARFLINCNVKAHTRATYRSYVHSWFRWLIHEGLRADNPVDGTSTARRGVLPDPRRRPPKFPQAWVQPVALWEEHSRAAGHSSLTIRHRVNLLSRVARTHSDPWAVTYHDLITHLSNPNWAAETRRSEQATLRSFYKWADKAHRNPREDPTADLPTVRVPTGQPRPTPSAVVAAALAAADPRARLMVMLGAHAGLRRAEIAKVHTRDVVDGLLRVTGKGGKTRLIPIGGELAAAIAARPPGYLFEGQDNGHISAGQVGRLLTDLLGNGWTPHTLRHAFASKAYAVERDILAVQQLLGHSSPSTTARYAAVPSDALRRAVDAAAG